MNNPISRQELYNAIDRQNEHLEKVILQGFTSVNQRLDVANGRTSKLEDRQIIVEKSVAILEDRANQAAQVADKSKVVASNSKWWATAASGVFVALIELVKSLLSGQ